MADNSAAKSHLKWVETKLSRIDNMWEINAIINETSLKLNENLSSNNLFIDEDIADHFSRIREKSPIFFDFFGFCDYNSLWNLIYFLRISLWPALKNLQKFIRQFEII